MFPLPLSPEWLTCFPKWFLFSDVHEGAGQGRLRTPGQQTDRLLRACRGWLATEKQRLGGIQVWGLFWAACRMLWRAGIPALPVFGVAIFHVPLR